MIATPRLATAALSEYRQHRPQTGDSYRRINLHSRIEPFYIELCVFGHEPSAHHTNPLSAWSHAERMIVNVESAREQKKAQFTIAAFDLDIYGKQYEPLHIGRLGSTGHTITDHKSYVFGRFLARE